MQERLGGIASGSPLATRSMLSAPSESPGFTRAPAAPTASLLERVSRAVLDSSIALDTPVASPGREDLPTSAARRAAVPAGNPAAASPRQHDSRPLLPPGPGGKAPPPGVTHEAFAALHRAASGAGTSSASAAAALSGAEKRALLDRAFPAVAAPPATAPALHLQRRGSASGSPLRAG